jgi:hypothetical protein
MLRGVSMVSIRIIEQRGSEERRHVDCGKYQQ